MIVSVNFGENRLSRCRINSVLYEINLALINHLEFHKNVISDVAGCSYLLLWFCLSNVLRTGLAAAKLLRFDEIKYMAVSAMLDFEQCDF